MSQPKGGTAPNRYFETDLRGFTEPKLNSMICAVRYFAERVNMNKELIDDFASCGIAALVGIGTTTMLLTTTLLLTTTTLLAQPQAAPQAAPQAQRQTNAPGYLLVLGRSLDRTKIIAYSATLPPIYAETGGRYIGIGRPGGGVTCVYGLCEGRSAVVARWADQAGIEAFWWGDAYRKAVRLRDGAGVFTVVGLKATSNVAPYDGGALLISTMSIPTASTSDSAAAQTWIDAAAAAGARLLVPPTATVIVPLEGDALYNRVALLSFESKDKRDAFAASAATKSLISSGPPLTIVSIIAVDAPPALTSIPAQTPSTK